MLTMNEKHIILWKISEGGKRKMVKPPTEDLDVPSFSCEDGSSVKTVRQYFLFKTEKNSLTFSKITLWIWMSPKMSNISCALIGRKGC